MGSEILILLGCFLTLFLQNSCSFHGVYIVPDDANKIPTLQSVTLNRFCQDAGDILDDTTVIFSSNNHSLNAPCEVNGVKNLTLRCEADSKAVIKCFNGSFIFLNVATLNISNIVFTGCGVPWTTTQAQLRYVKHTISSALLFVNGSNHILSDLSVQNSKSAGIYINNVGGRVNVTSCEVINAASHTRDTLSGSIIVYDDNMTAQSANLSISNSSFRYGGYRNLSACSFRVHNHTEIPFSSGLVLILGSSTLTVQIFNTSFSHNMGCIGGNLAVIFFKFMPVRISRSTFVGGHSMFGGGAYIVFENSLLDWIYSSVHYKYSPDVLTLTESKFINNSAVLYGGGLYVFWKKSLLLSGSADLRISNSLFEHNYVKQHIGGMALFYKTYLEDNNDPKNVSKLFISLNVSNCTFRNHNPYLPSEDFQPEYSVIQATSVPYIGIDGITVDSNNCTAIQAVESTLVFYGSTKIYNNRALTGAGIQLCSGAFMYLTPHVDLIITNNSAQQTGGGLQVHLSNCILTIPKCFVQYTREVSLDLSLLKTINFTISDNHAPDGGENIYGGTVDYCYMLWVNRNRHNLSINVPSNTINETSSVASDPHQVCITDLTSKYYCINNASAVIYPGEKVTIFVRVVGQRFGAVLGSVVASMDGSAVIDSSERVQAVNNRSGGCVTYTVYPLDTDLSRNATLYLKAGLPTEYEYKNKNYPARVQIAFKECPFGFVNAKVKSSPSKHACQCIFSKKISVTNCSIQHQTITKYPRSWIGEITIKNQTQLAYNKYCPLDYCNISYLTIQSGVHNLSQDEQCQYNRIGILCGSCPTGWSLVLGSSECREKCSNVWLLLIIPFALAGVLLVVVIHLLNLTVTMGTVCGLIFYANLLQDYFVTLFSSHRIPVLTTVLHIFFSWINLDLGISTCFYSGMEAFGKTMLLFIFPIYIWLISAIIIILSNRYISVTRLVGENALKVLSTLFLLSYSKMLRVTIGVLNVKFIYPNSSTAQLRWAIDGNISYLDPQRHLALFLIAVLFAIFLLPFTLSLLCICRVFILSNCSRAFLWIDKLKPFFDTYTGPFNDNARFWTGLLLLVRLFLLIVHTLDYRYDVTTYYVIVIVCGVLSLTMTALGGVYEKHCLNILEHFFIWNIGLISLAFTYKGGNEMNRSIICHILMSSVFLIFLGIIAYHFYLKFSQLGLRRRVKMILCRHRNTDEDMVSFDGTRSYGSTD